MAENGEFKEEEGKSISSDEVDEDTPMVQVLIWIGFENDEDQKKVMEHFGEDLEDFIGMTEDDLTEEIKSLGNRRTAGERLHFGMKRALRFRSVLHWVQDCDRINELPSIDEFDQLSFLRALEVSMNRATIRKESVKDRQSRAEAAMPDKLKDEKNWDTFEAELLNMLNIVLGVNGVPLAYVVREKEHEEGTVYNSFDEECISKARLTGPSYEADAKKVHQFIMSRVIGENAEQWLKENVKKADGRLDMEALRHHFRGSGNKSRRIAKATHLMNTLHYRNERALAFNVFISRAKKMFNIFEECDEPVPDTMQRRWLWNHIEDPKLSPTVSALQAHLARDPESFTFVSAADHIASQITVVNQQSRLSSVGSGNPSADDAPQEGVMKHGKVFTGSYQRDAWNKLSKAEKDKVFSARKSSGSSGGNGKGTKRSKQVKALQKKIDKQTKKLEEQSRKLSALSKNDDAESDSSSVSSDAGPNAGQQFGGQAGRSRKKSKKSE